MIKHWEQQNTEDGGKDGYFGNQKNHAKRNSWPERTLDVIEDEDAWDVVPGLDLENDLMGPDGWKELLSMLDDAYDSYEHEEKQIIFDSAFGTGIKHTNVRSMCIDAKNKWRRLGTEMKFTIPQDLKGYW